MILNTLGEEIASEMCGKEKYPKRRRACGGGGVVIIIAHKAKDSPSYLPALSGNCEDSPRCVTKLTIDLVNRFAVVSIEDLNVEGMLSA